jgi:hypothetical protein
MSNLGFQTVYRLFNAEDDIVCERFFLPPKQELAELLASRAPLVTLESQTPVGDFDVIAAGEAEVLVPSLERAFREATGREELLLALAQERQLEPALRTGLTRTRVAAVGPIVAAELAAAGLRVDAIPKHSYSMKPLVTSLCELLGRAS